MCYNKRHLVSRCGQALGRQTGLAGRIPLESQNKSRPSAIDLCTASCPQCRGRESLYAGRLVDAVGRGYGPSSSRGIVHQATTASVMQHFWSVCGVVGVCVWPRKARSRRQRGGSNGSQTEAAIV
jgi:hypothetical protein